MKFTAAVSAITLASAVAAHQTETIKACSAVTSTVYATATYAPIETPKPHPQPPKEHEWPEKPKEDCKDKSVFEFDAEYYIRATPDQVRNGTTPAPGQPGAVGLYKYGINLASETICYNITLFGVTGNYSSPANTATHIHAAAVGASGPPRIAFPNPVGDDFKRVSVGCLTGPFKTGIVNATTGVDSGDGFRLSMLVANPAAYMTDVHTSGFTLGAVRGQFPGL